MLGHKAREFRPLTAVSLEDLVPKDNFYRQLEERLDLRFLYDFVSSFYSEIGRPSIDPVVFFKLQLIDFFEGIRSERQLIETVNVNLAYRWFIGYDLTEAVPDHSSLSKIRKRYRLEVSSTRIARHFRDQGGVFPARPLTFRKSLKEAGYLLEQNGRLSSNILFDGRGQRVLVLKRNVLGEI